MTLLSIIVLSYNRPIQIERILSRFEGLQFDNVEIIIKDDCSPRLLEIEDLVDRFKKKLKVNLRLHVNNQNLGYDLNLIDSFNISRSEYVFLLSDDDYIDAKLLPQLLDTIACKKFDVYFTPYVSNGVIRRSKIPPYDINRFSNVIYNSILFSGLIFRRSSVLSLNLNSELLAHCIYSQVYISSILIYKAKSFGTIPVVILYAGGDGDNFFGKNKNAKNSNLLIDRTKITSELNYQFFLVSIVKEISLATSPLIAKNFFIEYKKRLVAYGFRARARGLNSYLNFIGVFLSSHSRNHFELFFIYLALVFIPGPIASFIHKSGIKLLRPAG